MLQAYLPLQHVTWPCRSPGETFCLWFYGNHLRRCFFPNHHELSVNTASVEDFNVGTMTSRCPHGWSYHHLPQSHHWQEHHSLTYQSNSLFSLRFPNGLATGISDCWALSSYFMLSVVALNTIRFYAAVGLQDCMRPVKILISKAKSGKQCS